MKIPVVTDWGEILELHIEPPKPGLDLEPGRYIGLWQRCGYHRCNQLLPVLERGNSSWYHSDECQKAAENQRAKERKVLRDQLGLSVKSKGTLLPK